GLERGGSDAAESAADSSIEGSERSEDSGGEGIKADAVEDTLEREEKPERAVSDADEGGEAQSAPFPLRESD
nr:hypothetical protein [Enterococcus faecalis]